MRVMWAVGLLLAGCVASPDAEAPASVPAHPVVSDLPEATSTPPAASPTRTTASSSASTAPPTTTPAPEPAYPEAWTKPPARPLPAELTGLEHVASVAGVTTGAGVATFGHYAFVGGYSSPQFWVVDIAQPTAPRVAATLDVPAGDVETIAYADGRLVAVTATRGNDILVVDITEPTSPKLAATIATMNGNHNLAVAPGTALVYNAPSQGRHVDIWDLTDPSRPQLVLDWENGAGCHAISFHGKRGYCAGLSETQVWDINDPRAPSVLARVPFPTAVLGLSLSPASFSHAAFVNHDGSVLVVGDETGGGAAPGCDAYAHAAGVTASGPLGNLWFYDLSDERSPRLRGHLSLNAFEARGACTAHFGSIVGERDHLVMAYYMGGVVLVDFRDLENPRIVDQWNPHPPTQVDVLAGTWDAWMYQGYVFTGDISRGMDVLTLV